MSAETTQQTQQTPADPKHAYYRAYSLGSSLDPEQYEIRDRIGTYQELLEFYNPTDEEWGEWVDGFVGLPHTDPRLVTMQQSGQYDFILQYTPVISTVEEGVMINSVPCQTNVTFGMPSKYGNIERKDLWAATINSLPYLTSKESSGESNQIHYTYISSEANYFNIKPFYHKNRCLVWPQQQKLIGYDPVNGSTESWKQENTKNLVIDSPIMNNMLTSTYTFEYYKNDDYFNMPIFDNLDHLVDMIYSLSFDFVDGIGQLNEMLPEGSSVKTQTKREKKCSMILKRRPIIIYCGPEDGFTNKQNIYTNSTYTEDPKRSKTYGKNIPYWDSFTMTKEDIKNFLIEKNFTPEFFKENQDNVSRRIVIDVYKEIGTPSQPLFTECAVVCFKDEIIKYHATSGQETTNHLEAYLNGSDGYLNSRIDISNYLTLLDFDPKIGKKEKFSLNELKNNYFNVRAVDDNLLELENSIAGRILKDERGEEATINSSIGSLALRLQQFKANFDYYGFVPFRACTELSLLGFKGVFVHRLEGFKAGQEVMHPLTHDLYLCIKDRPGLQNPECFNTEDYGNITHNYPTSSPTYSVLEDEEYFLKISKHNATGSNNRNYSELLCTKEQYQKYYKSSLPTYPALLSYLNLLIPAHEGLICPPIDPSLFRFNETDGEPHEINNQSTISYYRIFPKLKDGTIGDLSGLIKKGLKYKNNENNKKNANYTTDLEEFDIENTPFPYHWLDAYFNKTSGDKFFNMRDISTMEEADLRDFESRNAIDDALFGGWHKFRNKNNNKFIYVSSRPVFWTRDPELILGSNILHPRGHMLRIGTKFYWVRILTDKAYLQDEAAQETRAHSRYIGNRNIPNWEMNYVNSPLAVNFHESLINSTILGICDMAGTKDTPLCKRDLLWKNIDYVYPEAVDFNNILFSINNLQEKYKNLNLNIPTFTDSDYSNLKISDIMVYFRLVQSTFMSGKKYGVNGAMYYRADIGSFPYTNCDYVETLGNLTYDKRPKVGLGDSDKYKFNPQLDYNLQIVSNHKLADSVTGLGSGLKFITNGFFIPKVTSYFYDTDKAEDYKRLGVLSCLDSSYGLHNNVTHEYGNFKSGVTFRNVGTEQGEAWKKFPTLVNYRKFYVPNNVSHYVPVHIVLEAVYDSELPLVGYKPLQTHNGYGGQHNFTVSQTGISFGSNAYMYNNAASTYYGGTSNMAIAMADVMLESYPLMEGDRTTKQTMFNHNISKGNIASNNGLISKPNNNPVSTSDKLIVDGTVTNHSIHDVYLTYYNRIHSHPYALGWLNYNDYPGGRCEISYDINYNLSSSDLNSLINYTPGHHSSSDTPDTIYTNSDGSSFIYANRYSYGSYNEYEIKYKYVPYYSMSKKDLYLYPRSTGNDATYFNKWTLTGFMGTYDAKSNYSKPDENTGGTYDFNKQLSDIIKTEINFMQKGGAETSNSRKQAKNRSRFDYFYFKGKIVSVMNDAVYTLYEPDHYGQIYTPDKDHIEIGRTKPFDAADLYVNRVKNNGFIWDVTMPWLANDRSLHSNQSLKREVYPTLKHFNYTSTPRHDFNDMWIRPHIPSYIESVDNNDRFKANAWTCYNWRIRSEIKDTNVNHIGRDAANYQNHSRQAIYTVGWHFRSWISENSGHMTDISGSWGHLKDCIPFLRELSHSTTNDGWNGLASCMYWHIRPSNVPKISNPTPKS